MGIINQLQAAYNLGGYHPAFHWRFGVGFPEVFWLERALAEPSGKEVHHFIINALRSIQVVAPGRVDKENMGENAVNHLLVILRQAKQRVQAWRQGSLGYITVPHKPQLPNSIEFHSNDLASGFYSF